MTARKAGKSGQLGNSVGAYVCADLQCSLYLRGKNAGPGSRFHESITRDEQAARLVTGVVAFLDRVES